jgi:AraC-like DNA-binding protein
LGDLVLAAIDYPGQGYRRRWRHKKHPVLDHWIVSIPLARPPNGGDSVEAGPLRAQCLAQPHEGEGEDDGVLALFLPRDLPFTRPSRFAIREDAGRLLADYLLLLHRSLPALRVADVPHIVSATTSLAAVCLSPSADHAEEAQRSIDAVTMERAARIVTENLADRNLTPDQLCRALGVSRSSLYRIFEPVGGVSTYIRRKRLLRTRDMLADSTDGRPISAIAEEWGFVDASTYSRMFKKEFGLSPKEARVEGWRGVKHAGWLPGNRSGDGAWTLGRLLLGSRQGGHGVRKRAASAGPD